MRRTIAEEVILSYLNGGFFYRKGNTLKISQSGVITSQNTVMGYFSELEAPDGRYRNFLILTAQNFKSQKNWESQKKALALAANKQEYMVLFVPEIDIFMECENNENSTSSQSSGNLHYQTFDETYTVLIRTAKYSQDKDLQTAAMATLDNEIGPDCVLSYNQLIDGEFVHAEDVLCQYLECSEQQSKTFIMLLEPCAKCLESMIECGAENIFFGQLHKPKWNTDDYIQITNDIFNKTMLAHSDKPIVLRRMYNKKVDSFYKAKEVK